MRIAEFNTQFDKRKGMLRGRAAVESALAICVHA
jgi:hypothetical protein